jgi:dethiobiotin synthetase
MKGFSIVGIGTDVGKTVASAVISEAIGAAYFKPVQAGDLDNSDTKKIERWCSERVQAFPEIHRLSEPMAPHGAAEIDGVQLSLDDISFPKTSKPLVLEGAGGIMVPLNDKELFLDVYKKSGLPAIIISRHYLGSINHTFMTIEMLKANDIQIAGIIYVGEENETTEEAIKTYYNLTVLGRLILADAIDAEYVKKQAENFSHLVYEM